MSSDKQVSEALIGTVFEGTYRIEGIIGEGGMGAVYAATHLRLAKRVAVKVMARELASNSDALARFHREAVVTGGLGHPHIVQVFDFSTTPTGEPFLVMEFLEGEDLDHRLRRAGRLAAARTVTGVNPFTKKPQDYRPHPGVACVSLEGTEVGMMMWAEDGSSQIAVWATSSVVEKMATEVAAELGCVFERG